MIFDILPYSGGQITDERAFTLRYWPQIIVGPLKKACFALNSDWDCACKKISLYPMQRSFKMCIFNVWSMRYVLFHRTYMDKYICIDVLYWYLSLKKFGESIRVRYGDSWYLPIVGWGYRVGCRWRSLLRN